MPAAHLAPESGANNINTRGLAVKIHCKIVKAFLPDIWHKSLAGTRRADWHKLSFHTDFHVELFCINFWHVHLRRGIATLQVSVLFVGRRDAPAHLGSLSRAPAILQRLPMQGKWHLMGCVANEAVWAANGHRFLLHAFQPWPKPAVHLSSAYLCCKQQEEGCIPSWIPTSQRVCRQTKTGQGTHSWWRVICRLKWIICLGQYSLSNMCFSGATQKEKWLMLRDSDVGCETEAVLKCNDWEKKTKLQ